MNPNQSFMLYTAPDGAVKVEVYFQDETVWLTQKALAELFGVQIPAIAKHLKNIFESGELSREATVSKMEIVRLEGQREVARGIEYYNLDAIIAVGYRVNSYQATQFRIWATKTLREFIVKGFVLDDERL
ncbi:MAG: virulence RhuM family protein, partial [Lentisphaerae bacterium]|nr:virulence RhuM family protein [Lentisphaerota bacterium]